MISNCSINVRGKLIDLSTPKVMGIVNITPDSFYGSSRKKKEHEVLITVEKMLTDGASFIDVGGYSTRPQGTPVSEEEEINRVSQPIKILVKEFGDIIISVDTFRANVAKVAVALGASIVNDISGGRFDKKMLEVVGSLQVPYIGMHLEGTLETMHVSFQYDDIILHIKHYFSQLVEKCERNQIDDVILDPGFGFSKNIPDCFRVLNNLNLFKEINRPLLVGLSRKSMIYKTLGVPPEDALNGSLMLNFLSVFKGANILRVHDVKETIELIKLYKQL